MDDYLSAAMGTDTLLCELRFRLARPAAAGDDMLYLSRDYEQSEAGEFMPLRAGHFVLLFGLQTAHFIRMIASVGEGTIRINSPLVFPMAPKNSVVRPLQHRFSAAHSEWTRHRIEVASGRPTPPA